VNWRKVQLERYSPPKLRMSKKKMDSPRGRPAKRKEKRAREDGRGPELYFIDSPGLRGSQEAAPHGFQGQGQDSNLKWELTFGPKFFL